VVIGTAAAWLVERSTLPGRKIWNVLLVAPLAIPAFVNSYSWVTLVPEASGYPGALLIVTLSYFPFVYLPVAAPLRGLDRPCTGGDRDLARVQRMAHVRAGGEPATAPRGAG
jgi:ABC-type Fe3+ transport system permease subunit